MGIPGKTNFNDGEIPKEIPAGENYLLVYAGYDINFSNKNIQTGNG